MGSFIGTTELLKALFEEKALAKSALIRISRKPTKIDACLKLADGVKIFSSSGLFFRK